LLRLSAAELVGGMMKAQPGAVAGVTTYAPVKDGRTLPWSMDDPRALAGSADVPVILGTSLHETMLMLGGVDPSLFALSRDGLAERLSAGLRARWGWPQIDAA